MTFAIITGGASGIGKELARGLALAGRRVLIASRDPARAFTGDKPLVRDRTEAWPLDLSDVAAVRAFAARVRAELPPVDILVCNAGVWPRRRIVTPAGLELGFAVAHVGHFALVDALGDHLADGARVLLIASGLHARGRIAFDDLSHARGFDPLAAYAQAKLANVMFALSLARRAPRLRSNAIHPGIARTALHDKPPPGAIAATAAARGPLRLAMSAEHAATTGRYFDQLDLRKPAPSALDRATQDRLWSLTESLIR